MAGYVSGQERVKVVTGPHEAERSKGCLLSTNGTSGESLYCYLTLNNTMMFYTFQTKIIISN